MTKSFKWPSLQIDQVHSCAGLMIWIMCIDYIDIILFANGKGDKLLSHVVFLGFKGQ